MNKFFKTALGFLALAAVSANFTACSGKTSQTSNSLTENQAETTANSPVEDVNSISEPLSDEKISRNYDSLFPTEIWNRIFPTEMILTAI